MIRYGGGSTLFNFFNYAASKADVIIVGKYSGVAAAMQGQELSDCTGRFSSTGVYDRAVWLMTLPVTILGKLSDSVLFSGISRLQDDKPAVQRVFLSGTYFISMLVFPGCMFLVFFSEEVVLTLLGDQYFDAIPVARILFVGVAFRALIKLSDAIVRALDAVYTASAIKALFLALVIGGTLLGLDNGLIGVATNLVAAIGIQYVLMTALSLRLSGLKGGKVIGKMIPGFMVALATGVVALVPYLLLNVMEVPPLIGLILATVMVGVGLAALAWYAPWLFGKGRDNVLRMAAARMPKRGFFGRLRSRFGAD
jgi:O-antigen/teichoic acid export membrane protein